MLSRWALDNFSCIESTTGLVPVVVRNKMLQWKDDSSWEVLGGSSRRQEISKTMIPIILCLIFNLQILCFFIKNFGEEKYTAAKLTFIHRRLHIYLDIYDKWYHRKWEGAGKEKVTRVIWSTRLFSMWPSKRDKRYLSQIHCTNICGPCNFVTNITNETISN